MRFATLGTDVVIGSQVWDATTRFRIVLGPLPLASYRRFLPNGDSHVRLRDMVSLYVGVEYQWDLVPVLERQEVPDSRAGDPCLQLGWSAWLGSRDAKTDARDLLLPMTPRLS